MWFFKNPFDIWTIKSEISKQIFGKSEENPKKIPKIPEIVSRNHSALRGENVLTKIAKKYAKISKIEVEVPKIKFFDFRLF